MSSSSSSRLLLSEEKGQPSRPNRAARFRLDSMDLPQTRFTLFFVGVAGTNDFLFFTEEQLSTLEVNPFSGNATNTRGAL